MANTATITGKMVNSFEGSTVVEPVTHSIPEFIATTSAIDSVVAELTGTGSNAIAINASNNVTVGGVVQTHPVTKANLEFQEYHGLAVSVGRAAPATAPTGDIVMTSTGFCGITTGGNITLNENSLFLFRRGTAVAAVNAQTLTINLTGTTGYKVSLIALGSNV